MAKKYEFTGAVHPVYRYLKRIRALVDIPLHGIKAGDMGGWLEGEHNLSHDGACWVCDNSIVQTKATVTDDAVVIYASRVGGSASVRDTAIVAYKSEVGYYARIQEEAHICDLTSVRGNAVVKGRTIISGGSVIYGHAVIKDRACISGNVHVYEYATVSNEARVIASGNPTLSNTAIHLCNDVHVGGQLVLETPGIYDSVRSLPNYVFRGVLHGDNADHMLSLSLLNQLIFKK